jgi:hypothetical protein
MKAYPFFHFSYVKTVALMLALILLISFIASLPFSRALSAHGQVEQQEQLIQVGSLPEPEIGTVTRGRASETTFLGNNTYQTKIGGFDPWTFDKSTNQWIPHLVYDDEGTTYVQSGLISWQISPHEAKIYDSNMEKYIAKERWSLKISDVAIEKFFQSQSWRANSTGVFVTNTYSVAYQDLTVTMKVLYAVWDARPTERIVTVEGLPSALFSLVKIDRQWTDLSIARIITDDMETIVGASSASQINTGTRTFVRLVSSDGNTTITENLLTAGDKLDSYHYDASSITFVYDGWSTLDSALVLKDDTFTSGSDSTHDFEIRTGSGTGATCPTTGFTDAAVTDSTLRMKVEADPTSSYCSRIVIEYDVSSITDSSDITAIDFDFEISAVSSPRNGDIMPMASQPSVSSDETVWNDCGDGTALISNSGVFVTTGVKEILFGETARANLEAQLTSDWWAFCIKPTSEARDGSLHSTTIYSETGPGADPIITVTFTPPVTVPVAFNFRSGSDTFETAGTSATVTCNTQSGSTIYNHDGNPSSQSFVCLKAVTVTVTMPTDAATSRFRFSDGDTQEQFAACNSGTCTTTTYSDVTRQFKIGITPSGLDANRNVGVTRTQLGSTASENVLGVSQTFIWADQASNVVTSNEVIITANQDRFYSYNSTAQRTVTLSAGVNKTYAFQHEYFTLFRIFEKNLGTQLASTPSGTFSGSINSANGTSFTATFNTALTDDYLETSSRTWVKNGTTSWTNILWRTLNMNATGSMSIASYGNFDINVKSRHYGFNVDRNFRIGFDAGNVTDNSVSYSDVSRVLSFDITATGTKNGKVEFPLGEFTSATSITVNGAEHSDFTSTDDAGKGVLNINNVPFSTKTISIIFRSTPGSGGGGGDGGTIFPGPGSLAGLTPSGTALALAVTVPTLVVEPGKPTPFNLTLTWSGAESITIREMTFSPHPEWFNVDVELPATISPTWIRPDTPFKVAVPVTVTVPADVPGLTESFNLNVVITSGSSTSEETIPLRLIYASQPLLAWLTVAAVMTLILVGVVWGTVKKRGSGFYRG